jgi:hypothetical protein
MAAQICRVMTKGEPRQKPGFPIRAVSDQVDT